jgi:pyruvate/2-oxoglutarate dehydrogenase complex dihydrolipoamide dehydrogenase (E3) component
MGAGIKSIETKDGVAVRVHLTNGTSIEADTILIGAGAIPNT